MLPVPWAVASLLLPEHIPVTRFHYGSVRHMTLLLQLPGSFPRFLSGMTVLSTPSKTAFSPPFLSVCLSYSFFTALTKMGAFVELDPCL